MLLLFSNLYLTRKEQDMTSDRILPGDMYEDCDYHPVLCTSSSIEEDHVEGISLIDGSMPRSCSYVHCDVQRLSVAEAVHLRQLWDDLFPKVVRDLYLKNKFEIISHAPDEEFLAAILTLVREAAAGVVFVDGQPILDLFLEFRSTLGISVEVPTQPIISSCLLRAERYGFVEIRERKVLPTEAGNQFCTALK